mmetsp:Transcript_53277/g.147184  ORF Transcript_53277/g.147184 Transcript_53277/m.147184 type:complete len:386 (-) Transcript_53277:60-1217(-)
MLRFCARHSPESAALFFIPVMLMQMRDSLWEAKRFLPAVIHHISSRYPFWNRSNGADHYIFTGQDMGGCWIPELLRNAHIVSHFGFTASIKLWVNQPKWMEARQERDQRAWLGGENYTSYLFPKCYRRHKDVVVPIDVSVPREDRERQHARLAAECGADGDAPEAPKKVSARSKTLLYMAGSVVPSNKGGSGFYSQGVRQFFHKLHRNTPGVVFDVGGWGVAGLRDATFCLAPSGWGYGWRISISLAMHCIPVIIQPLVEQAYHDMLPYKSFSLRFAPADVPILPHILRHIERNRSRICELRSSAARYYRTLLWEPPGLAYDMLQISLCRRALLRVLRDQAPAQRRLPPWYRCAQLTAESLLAQTSDHVIGEGWPAIEPSPSGGR